MTSVLLGLSLLLGASPPQGVIAFDATPGASISAYPRVEPGRIDLVVKGNRVPLRDQLEDMTARYVQDVDVTSIGGGTWFVTLRIDRPDVVLVPQVEPRRIVLRLRRGTVTLSPPEGPGTLRALLDSPPARQPLAPPEVALTPLRGDASTLTISPDQILQQAPSWDVPGVSAGDARGWRAVDAYRAILTTTRDPAVRAASRYRLGLEHMGLGWYREAAYYLEDTLASHAEVDIAAVSLAAARAHVVQGHAARTEELCRQSAAAGAGDVAVLVCLGTAAMNGGSPSPTHVGRLLDAASRVPDHRLLAAQLLQQDHRHVEARGILEALARGTEDARVHASLGDARYHTGDVPGAKAAWAAASGRDRRLVGRMDVRMRMAEMVEDGPAEWASRIPTLLALADRDGPEAAEAHYLLAQVANTYGDPDLAAEHLNKLWDRFPQRALTSDAPERLVTVCGQRLDMLERSGQIAEQIAFFGACWRDELDQLTSDGALLRRNAARLVDLGLDEEALGVQLRAMAIYTRLGVEEPDALVELSALYVVTDRAKEALQTLSYARTLASAPAVGPMRAVEAAAHTALDQPAQAEVAWRDALDAKVPTAPRGLGLLLAGSDRCREAVELLQGSTEPDAALAHARCLLSLGRGDEVAAALPEADPASADEVDWIRSAAASVIGAESAPASAGIWAELQQEEEESTAFAARLERFR